MKKIILFFALSLVVSNAVAGWDIYGRDADKDKAVDKTDYKAAALAMQKGRCVSVYANYNSCIRDPDTRKWQCHAIVAKNKGSCGGGLSTLDHAIQTYNRLKPIIEAYAKSQ